MGSSVLWYAVLSGLFSAVATYLQSTSDGRPETPKANPESIQRLECSLGIQPCPIRIAYSTCTHEENQ